MNRLQDSFIPEPERYEFTAPPLHNFELARRDFFKLLGAGVAVFVAAKNALAQETATPPAGFRGQELPKEINAWLHIGEDGTVTAFTGKAEMGQNIRTSLTQSVADELRVPFESVHFVMADTAQTPFDFGTVGSRTTPGMAPQLRSAASAARDILVGLAAKEWNVSREGLVAKDAKVTDPASGRSLKYAELAKGKALAQNLPAEDPVTPTTEWTVAGKSLPKVDGRAFVTGKHQYTPDLRPEGLLYGKILRPPSFGATLASYDDSATKAMSGAVVVRDGDFVGAAAATEREAQKALEAIHAEWKEVPQISDRELFARLKQTAKSKSRDENPRTSGEGRPGERGAKKSGSIEQGFAQAAHKVEATYSVAFIAHAPMEPRAAVAEWSNGKVTVWTGSQRPFAVRTEVANAMHVPEGDVRVIVPDTGSAYGGKHTGEVAVEAARLAKAAGRPVRVFWTREEEFTWAYFRPAGVIDVRSGIASDGKLTAWEFHNYNSGSSAIDTPYAVANRHVEFHSADCPLRSGSYRGLAATANHFARETHMDASAHAAQMEPFEFRMQNASDPRLRAVLETAAKSFGWPRKKTQEGQGFGIAAGFEKGSYVATCAEITVDRGSGGVRVVRVVEAFECGAIVNPDGLKNQVVGAVIQGLGGALFEAISFENGRIKNPHFAQYRVARFRDVPEIEAVLIDRKDIPSAGAGETPIMGIAPAIGNAIFDATGIRLNSMPLVPNGIKA
jgi:CO/xanthine dehydrogenase Mo-binding subunit